jgi:hypothetical protein
MEHACHSEASPDAAAVLFLGKVPDQADKGRLPLAEPYPQLDANKQDTEEAAIVTPYKSSIRFEFHFHWEKKHQSARTRQNVPTYGTFLSEFIHANLEKVQITSQICSNAKGRSRKKRIKMASTC